MRYPIARFARAAVLSATLLAVVAPNASAALVLEFDPPMASPGTVVSAETVGAPGSLFGENLMLFLAPAKVADRIKSSTDPRLSPIGELNFDEEGVGRITFTVPDVAPGQYMAIVPTGISAAEPFRVTAAGHAEGLNSNGDGGLPTGVLIVLVAAGIVLAGAGIAWAAKGVTSRASPR